MQPHVAELDARDLSVADRVEGEGPRREVQRGVGGHPDQRAPAAHALAGRDRHPADDLGGFDSHPGEEVGDEDAGADGDPRPRLGVEHHGGQVVEAAPAKAEPRSQVVWRQHDRGLAREGVVGGGVRETHVVERQSRQEGAARVDREAVDDQAVVVVGAQGHVTARAAQQRRQRDVRRQLAREVDHVDARPSPGGESVRQRDRPPEVEVAEVHARPAAEAEDDRAPAQHEPADRDRGARARDRVGQQAVAGRHDHHRRPRGGRDVDPVHAHRVVRDVGEVIAQRAAARSARRRRARRQRIERLAPDVRGRGRTGDGGEDRIDQRELAAGDLGGGDRGEAAHGLDVAGDQAVDASRGGSAVAGHILDRPHQRVVDAGVGLRGRHGHGGRQRALGAALGASAHHEGGGEGERGPSVGGGDPEGHGRAAGVGEARLEHRRVGRATGVDPAIAVEIPVQARRAGGRAGGRRQAQKAPDRHGRAREPDRGGPRDGRRGGHAHDEAERVAARRAARVERRAGAGLVEVEEAEVGARLRVDVAARHDSVHHRVGPAGRPVAEVDRDVGGRAAGGEDHARAGHALAGDPTEDGRRRPRGGAAGAPGEAQDGPGGKRRADDPPQSSGTRHRGAALTPTDAMPGLGGPKA